jgi:hypothetical protein
MQLNVTIPYYYSNFSEESHAMLNSLDHICTVAWQNNKKIRHFLPDALGLNCLQNAETARVIRSLPALVKKVPHKCPLTLVVDKEATYILSGEKYDHDEARSRRAIRVPVAANEPASIVYQYVNKDGKSREELSKKKHFAQFDYTKTKKDGTKVPKRMIFVENTIEENIFHTRFTALPI